MTYRIGVLGYSAGNGHPLSFSAIINGFDDSAMAAAGWPVIHGYLKARKPDDFGFGDARVTSIWTPDAAQAETFAKACRIDSVASAPEAMIGTVDAVMILRDDAETHLPLAMPFLTAGLPVFVDKPLCITAPELRAFRPYLDSGQLMSCSGLRFCAELDSLRADPERLGRVKLIRASVVVDWARYGIHMLEAAMGTLPIRPVAVQRHRAEHESVAVRMDNGTLMLIDALGAVPKTFTLDFYGDKAIERVEISDNFSAFRRTIGKFLDQARLGRPGVAPGDTVRVIETLMAGLAAAPGGPEITIEDVTT